MPGPRFASKWLTGTTVAHTRRRDGWVTLKLPCKGTPSKAGRAALRRIWNSEHPTGGMRDRG
eukprot:5224136-Amphidinium_carterae.1